MFYHNPKVTKCSENRNGCDFENDGENRVNPLSSIVLGQLLQSFNPPSERGGVSTNYCNTGTQNNPLNPDRITVDYHNPLNPDRITVDSSLPLSEQNKVENPCPFTIEGAAPLRPSHRQELSNSAIADDVAALNFFSIEGEDAMAWILGDKVAPDSPHRRNDGRLRDGVLRIAQALEDGGWGFETLDQWGQSTGWGQLKPATPRMSKPRGFGGGKPKTIKYESPHGRPDGLILLRYPDRLTPPTDGPIWITEGGKKTAALVSQGVAAIGLNGIWGWKRNGEISPPLAELVKGRNVIIALDQDTDGNTRRKVKKSRMKLAKALHQLGCTALNASWPVAWGKGADDLLAGGKSLSDLTLTPVLTHPYTHLRGADQRLNCRYLSLPDLQIPTGKKMIAVASPKGTGKTWGIMRPYVDQALDRGDKVIVLTHRIGLGQDIASKISIPYFRDDCPEGRLLGFIITADSLHERSAARITPEDLEGAVIIVDEWQQFLWHCLSSTTEVRQRRIEVLQNLKHAFKTAKQILIMDADLNDIGIKHAEKWAGIDKGQTHLVVNGFMPLSPKVTAYDGKNPDKLIMDLIDHVKNGGRPLVHLVGQKVTSKYGTRNLAQKLRLEFPHLKIGVIDSQSKKLQDDPGHNATENINDWVAQYDIVIYSPSIGTGVSIDVAGHFDSVWAVSYGRVSPDSFRQALARLREPVPRYIWVAQTALNSDFVGTGETHHQAVIEQIQAAKTTSLARYQKLIGELLLSDFSTAEYCPDNLNTWGMIVASRNYGFRHYRDSVIDGLIDEGCEMVFLKTPKGVAKKFAKGMAQNRDKAIQDHAVGVAAAPEISDSELKLLSEQKSLKNEAESHQLEKGKLREKYGMDVTPELVVKDLDGWGEKIGHHYRIKHGFTPCPEFNGASLLDIQEQAKSRFDDGVGFGPDIANRHKRARVAAILCELGIDYILGQEFLRGDDPRLAEINSQAVARRHEIKIVAGITINPKNTPIQTAQSLLGIIGFKSPYLRKEGAMGEQVRIYGMPCPAYEQITNKEGKKTRPIVNPETQNLIPLWDERDQVFDYWLQRDLAKIQGWRWEYDQTQAAIAKAELEAKAVATSEAVAVAMENEATTATTATTAFNFAPFVKGQFKRGDTVGVVAVDPATNEYNPDSLEWVAVDHFGVDLWGAEYAIAKTGRRINVGAWVAVAA